MSTTAEQLEKLLAENKNFDSLNSSKKNLEEFMARMKRLGITKAEYSIPLVDTLGKFDTISSKTFAK
ncbi:MAG: hypothetical protein ACRCYO_03100 [Bacteroidia bacterium]